MSTDTGFEPIQRRPAETAHQAKHWWVYLPEVSRDAREWCDAYNRFGIHIATQTGAIVRDLQRRKLERAWQALEDCRSELEALAARGPRPVATVVEVSYLSTLAYYHYHAAEFDTARDVLTKAVSVMEETLSLAPFLLPCVGQCYDYRLHLARIARAESRWDDMFKQIEIGRKMVYGELPLCHASWGPVFLKDICAFYGNAKPLNDIEHETLRRLSDQGNIQREYDSRCIAATIVPFIVVDWCGG